MTFLSGRNIDIGRRMTVHKSMSNKNVCISRYENREEKKNLHIKMKTTFSFIQVSIYIVTMHMKRISKTSCTT